MTEASLALSYAKAGIPVFPCRAADEETGEYDRETGELIVYKAKTPLVSSGFKGATKNERVIRILWERNPGAMVGIPTGEQLGAWVLDVDVHKDDDGNVINGYETLAALEQKHGPLPVTATARTAGGGEHRYFKYAAGVRNRGKLGAGLDVRGSGGYVIAPGSKTGDGKEYVWLDHDGDGLPPLAEAPDWILSLVLPPVQTHAASAYEYAAGDNDVYVERAVEAELNELATALQGSRGEQVNKSAFNLGTLVGAGALSRHEAEAGLFDAAYANGVVAKDGEKEIRAKIRRGLDAGIKKPRAIPERQYADDGTKPMPVDGIIKSGMAKHAQPEQQVDIVAPAANDNEAVSENPVQISDIDDDPPEYKLEAVANLEDLTNPGGLVEELIDWIVSSAEYPSRTLAMAAVLPMVASLCGSRFSTGSRDTRPNIYTVALAESGFGKEHARSQIKRILMSDHGVFSDYSGPARIMSASALREVLEKNSSVNCQIDEFGGFVREITDRKAGSHQRAISTDMRDYYSASSTFFEGAAYRGTPPKRIYNPCLCIHGTSTPEQFWTALSSASAEDGLLPRLILFHVKGDKPQAVKPVRDVRDVPYILMERMARVAGIDVAKKRGNVGATGIKVKADWTENKPHIVPWTPDAESVFRAVKETIDAKEGRVAVEGRPFMRRIVENAIKLALIVAVGKDPENPRITEYDFEWAASLAWTCAAGMLAEVGERLADNQREANFKKIASLIRQSGKKGITEGRLFDRCKAIDGWQRKEILDDLTKGGKVEYAANENKSGRPTRRLVWVA
ncbi:bifunctional DNA primase/polymerase [Mesorhizobium sp. ESP-6-4]|uniref:bifunctional DNA primase/polymerase n=1 Tax=Mesorhizobium sp. ESP-6-4 TaxID=2876624 RepID=UPI001CCF71F7|nr:bifunctional DNA primase/polymerase [Mesorhizobium sp. ESP-6-4]MBZ9659800.1 bifunctional DNA primase/polymerase [Mesorhizobium sp. ESP-6-4]